MNEPTDEEMEAIHENFETTTLLEAVDLVDELRTHLNDPEGGIAPPEIRLELLRLHDLAMSVVNRGDKSKAEELFTLAMEIEDQVVAMQEALESIAETLTDLTRLYPKSWIQNA